MRSAVSSVPCLGSTPSRGSQVQEVHKVKNELAEMSFDHYRVHRLGRMEQNLLFGLFSSPNLIDASFVIFIKQNRNRKYSFSCTSREL